MCKFMPALHDLKRRGIAETVGRGLGVRWKLAPPEHDLL
jgi:hypothetical protein